MAHQDEESASSPLEEKPLLSKPLQALHALVAQASAFESYPTILEKASSAAFKQMPPPPATFSSLPELSQALREGTCSLKEAILSRLVPDVVLHRFACDVAEEALLYQQRQKGWAVPTWCFEGLRLKRLWAEGRVGDASLCAAYSATLVVAHRTAERAALNAISRTADSAAYWASARAAYAMAEGQSRREDFEETRQKLTAHQCALLASMCEELSQQRAWLLSVIKKRYDAFSSQMKLFQQELEDAIF
ncbi:MAG: hypothetical protein H6728_17080 [Myxococcales bacterium]|nr:hypothetical protein [Myxococcales bacterium]MCB9644788.1 hypothetical protein [Myxococcales bacterium]